MRFFFGRSSFTVGSPNSGPPYNFVGHTQPPTGHLWRTRADRGRLGATRNNLRFQDPHGWGFSQGPTRQTLHIASCRSVSPTRISCVSACQIPLLAAFGLFCRFWPFLPFFFGIFYPPFRPLEASFCCFWHQKPWPKKWPKLAAQGERCWANAAWRGAGEVHRVQREALTVKQ